MSDIPWGSQGSRSGSRFSATFEYEMTQFDVDTTRVLNTETHESSVLHLNVQNFRKLICTVTMPTIKRKHATQESRTPFTTMGIDGALTLLDDHLAKKRIHEKVPIDKENVPAMEYKSMTMVQLKQLCKERHLPPTGTKTELVE